MVAVRVDQEGGIAGRAVIDQQTGRAGVAAGERRAPVALPRRSAGYRWNISSKETNNRGENYHEGDRGDGRGGGNGRDEAGGAARAAGIDKRRRRSGSCVGIHLG